MNKTASNLWRVLATVVLVLSLVSVVSVQAAISAPATVSAADCGSYPIATPSSPIPSPTAAPIVPIDQDLSWAVSANATAYDIYFGTTNPPAKVVTGNTTRTYDPGVLQCGTTYYWMVAATNASCEGAFVNGSPWTFTTQPCCPTPAKPVLLAPANGAEGVNIQPTLSWNAARGATSYNVYLLDEDMVNTVNTSLVWPYALEACEEYTWYVEAVSSGECVTAYNQSDERSFETGAIVGAVTGWTWEFPYNTLEDDFFDGLQHPYDTNTRTSIMVVFDEDCSCWGHFSDLTVANFKVTYPISSSGKIRTVANEVPASLVVHQYTAQDYLCGHKNHGNEEYNIAFLTLSQPMTTNATPTVYLLDANDAGQMVVVQTVTADDGIAPIIDLSISGSPYQGGDITVTATATEPIDMAQIVTDTDHSSSLPNVNLFPAIIEHQTHALQENYGGYCTHGRGLSGDDTHLKYMWPVGECSNRAQTNEEGSNFTYVNDCPPTNVFSRTFRNMEAVDPQESFLVEVYAHDYSWCDSCCQDDTDYWWRHENWGSSSQFIQGQDTIVLHLVEGWNLISFPRTPTTSTLRGTFGDNIVNKVYTYRAGKWYGAIYSSADGTWKTPSGFSSLTSVAAGVGYWVYCSNAGVEQRDAEENVEELADLITGEEHCNTANIMWSDLLVEVQPVNPLAVPPSYSLTSGWNLVGVPIQGSLDELQMTTKCHWFDSTQHIPVTPVTDFLNSVEGHWKVIYWYLPTFTVSHDSRRSDTSYTFPSGYQSVTSDTTMYPSWNLAFWMTALGGFSALPGAEEDEIWPGDYFSAYLGGDISPMVLPGFGYWVWMDEAGTLVPITGYGSTSLTTSPSPI